MFCCAITRFCSCCNLSPRGVFPWIHLGGGSLNPQTLRATFGGLLHDVGKLAYRAGEDARDHATSGEALLRGLLPGEEWRGTLDCVRYHHARALRQAVINGGGEPKC